MAALTPDIQERVIFYLGYPSKILRDNSTHFNRILNNRMTNLSDFGVQRVKELVDKIEDARTKLDQTPEDAHVSSIDEISLDTSMAVTNIQKQYTRYVKELSSFLDIPIRKNNGAGVGSIRVRVN